MMKSRPRSDIYINLPVLQKLEILESFKDTEFWYAENISATSPRLRATSFRKIAPRKDEKWWLPVPCVLPGGLSEKSRKHLTEKWDCANRIHKAAMAINSNILTEIDIPETYIDDLPKECPTVISLEQFPDTAGTIISIHVDSDVMSLDGRQCLETEAEVKEDGKLHVTVRKSNASRSDIYSRRSHNSHSHANTTPCASNLTNAEIYSLQSSWNPTPRGSSFNHTDFYSMMGRNSNFGASDLKGTTPRSSNYDLPTTGNYPAPNPGMFSPKNVAAKKANNNNNSNSNGQVAVKTNHLHMFVWSSSGSPISDVFDSHLEYGGTTTGTGNAVQVHQDQKQVKLNLSPKKGLSDNGLEKRLILIMLWRKLIRNPNTYSNIMGLT